MEDEEDTSSLEAMKKPNQAKPQPARKFLDDGLTPNCRLAQV